MSNTYSEGSKLTKKQKKSLTFRERKSGKRSKTTEAPDAAKSFVDGDDELAEMDANALPAMEDQDIAGMEGDSVEVGAVPSKAGGEAAKGVQGGRVVPKKKKVEVPVEAKVGEAVGKPEPRSKDKGKGKAKDDTPRDAPQAVKKRKRDEDEEEDEKGEEKMSKKSKKGDIKQRFILFVGMYSANSLLIFHV